MWQVIVSAALVLGLAIIAAFWALADPRADIRDIKSSYTTLREHNDLITRMDSNFKRIEENNRTVASQLASKVQVEEHNHADDAARSALIGRLDAMQRQIDLLISRSLIQPPPNVSR